MSCVHNGYIAKSTYEIIEAFLEQYPDAEHGLAHITLADCNVEDYHIEFCLSLSEMAEPERGFLRWLLTIPEDLR